MLILIDGCILCVFVCERRSFSFITTNENENENTVQYCHFVTFCDFELIHVTFFLIFSRIYEITLSFLTLSFLDLVFETIYTVMITRQIYGVLEQSSLK